MERYEKTRAESILEPRLLSIGGFMNLFNLAIMDCSLRKRQDSTDQEIAKIKEELARLKQVDSDQQAQIEKVDKEQTEARHELEQAQEVKNGTYTKQISDAFKMLAFQKEMMKQQQQNFKAHKDEFETVESDFIRFKEDF